MAEDTKAVATKQQNIKDLILSDGAKKQFAAALPKHLSPDRFIRIALTAVTKNPKIAECTRESLFSCLLDLSQLGLEPDGRRAHLIPYGNKCTLIVDYKGLVELVINTGQVSNVHADVVCMDDSFVYNKGTIETHSIDFKRPRGDMYAVYCVISFKDGTTKTEVMQKDDVDAIRKRSKASSSGPWVTDYNEMAKKTVFRRASKWVKLSPEQRDVIEKDDKHQFEPIVEAGKPVVSMPQEIDSPKKQEHDEVMAAEIVDAFKQAKNPTEREKIKADNQANIDALPDALKQWVNEAYGG